MKKLLEELENKRDSYNKSGDYATGRIQGINIAIEIVKKYNSWHSVEKDGLPEPDKLLWFLCRDRSVFLGYYESFIEDGELCYLWSVLNGMIYREGNEIVVESVFDDDYDVTHYRYIPTDLPEVKP